MTINLHEIANTLGYGKAETALRKAGKWKLTPEEEAENRFEVAMSRLRMSLEQVKDAIGDADMAIDDCCLYADNVYKAIEPKT